jgi:hypothetical protein
MQEYQENQRRYNQNIQHILELIENEQIRNPLPRRTTSRARPSQRSNEHVIYNWMRYYLSNREPNLQDVVVRPTNRQIENATELILYDNSIPHSQCSITLEPFEEDEEICRIKHCLHCFKKNAIYDWFHRNVRCPVCRYDIREYRNPMLSEESEDDIPTVPIPNPSPPETAISPLMRSLQSTLQTIFSQRVPLEVDESDRQLLYTFDIPLSMDFSGNFRL